MKKVILIGKLKRFKKKLYWANFQKFQRKNNRKEIIEAN